MKKIIIAAIVGAIIIFVWMMVSWMALPFHQQTLKTFKDPQAMEKAVHENAPTSGVYIIPSFDDHEKMKNKYTAVFASISLDTEMNMNRSMLYSFLTAFVAALLVATLVGMSNVEHYACRYMMIVFIGLTIAIQSYIPMWNWWHVTADYILAGMADIVIAWALAGLAMAYLL